MGTIGIAVMLPGMAVPMVCMPPEGKAICIGIIVIGPILDIVVCMVGIVAPIVCNEAVGMVVIIVGIICMGGFMALDGVFPMAPT